MKTKMTRPVVLAGVCAVAALLCAAVWFFGTYTWIGGLRYRKDIQSLDLSGAPISQVDDLASFQNLQSLNLRDTGLTIAQYDQVKTWHPDCRILWQVPFQGGFLEEATEAVAISSLSEADIEALAHLPSLKQVQAEGCTDYAQLVQLQSRCPDVTVTYDVPLNGEFWSNHTNRLVLTDASSNELMERLAWLPSLEAVTLLGALPTQAQLETLQQAYPGITFDWCLELGGEKLKTGTETLTLSGWKLKNEAALEELLAYGPGLKKLVVLDSGLNHNQFLAVQERHPQLELVWEITVEGRTFRTDTTELDLSGIPFTSAGQAEQYFSYFPHLAKVDMSNTGLSNEELDALNKKYGDIRIVWLVQICEKGGIMSDATYFMPYQLGTIVTDKEMALLKYCPDLICVDVGHMGITNCEFVKYLPNLQYLIMADTDLNNIEPLRGHQNLIFLEIFMTQVTDYSPLVECPNLLDLNIANNRGDLTPLAQMTWLERLWLAPHAAVSHKNMPEIQMLREALPNTQIEYSGYSTGMGWRQHPRYYEMRDIMGMFYLE